MRCFGAIGVSYGVCSTLDAFGGQQAGCWGACVPFASSNVFGHKHACVSCVCVVWLICGAGSVFRAPINNPCLELLASFKPRDSFVAFRACPLFCAHHGAACQQRVTPLPSVNKKKARATFIMKEKKHAQKKEHARQPTHHT